MLYVLQKFSETYSIVIVAVEEVCAEHIGDEEIKFRANCPSPLNLGDAKVKSKVAGNPVANSASARSRSQCPAQILLRV